VSHACPPRPSSLSLDRVLPQYQREFGFVLEDRAILVDDTRVRATGRAVDLPQSEHISANPGAACVHGRQTLFGVAAAS